MRRLTLASCRVLIPLFVCFGLVACTLFTDSYAFTSDSGEDDAYVLFAPLRQTITYLIDLDGNVVHDWDLSGKPGNSVYLVEGGNLLATYGFPNSFSADGSAGGVGTDVAIRVHCRQP